MASLPNFRAGPPKLHIAAFAANPLEQNRRVREPLFVPFSLGSEVLIMPPKGGEKAKKAAEKSKTAQKTKVDRERPCASPKLVREHNIISPFFTITIACII